MKTDRVLTMDECLNGWGMVPTRVEPAGCDARHIPIAEEKHVGFEEERTQLQLRSLGSSVSRNEVKHGIPSVAAMMIGYVWIIGRCLPNA